MMEVRAVLINAGAGVATGSAQIHGEVFRNEVAAVALVDVVLTLETAGIK